jgi:hypothetical protein
MQVNTTLLVPNYRYSFAILAYLFLFITIYGILFYFGFLPALPDNTNLVHLDASYYSHIKDVGYEFKPGNASNAGFFPFFSLLWKITGLTPLGISILNGFIYLCSLYLLCVVFKPDLEILGMYMSLPFMFYFFIPYSESLFFLFSVLILYGLYRNNNVLVFIGLIFAGLTRPSFLFFIPAFLGVTLMLKTKAELRSRKTWLDLVKWYMLPVLISVLLIGVAQYITTGHFFAYYEVQSGSWGRKFSWPKFPLGSNSELLIVQLQWFNFWFGMLIATIGVILTVQWIRFKNLHLKIERHELFALIFLIMALISIVFFNPKWFWINGASSNSTNLTGISRYMETNAFAFVALLYLFKVKFKSPWYLLILLISTHLVWFLVFPEYFKHIQIYLKIALLTLILILYWLYHYTRLQAISSALILLGFVMQAILLGKFLGGILAD